MKPKLEERALPRSGSDVSRECLTSKAINIGLAGHFLRGREKYIQRKSRRVNTPSTWPTLFQFEERMTTNVKDEFLLFARTLRTWSENEPPEISPLAEVEGPRREEGGRRRLVISQDRARFRCRILDVARRRSARARSHLASGHSARYMRTSTLRMIDAAGDVIGFCWWPCLALSRNRTSNEEERNVRKVKSGDDRRVNLKSYALSYYRYQPYNVLKEQVLCPASGNKRVNSKIIVHGDITLHSTSSQSDREKSTRVENGTFAHQVAPRPRDDCVSFVDTKSYPAGGSVALSDETLSPYPGAHSKCPHRAVVNKKLVTSL
ncbi:hypothetical protein EVAR_53780_1 [Eumeta japonica]|uniref:Uncharacterized protein n=1 Tax=Eumeta variegata TaxID=151549 RepID=A0A4C1Z4S4_EUMVA|nr:hypothetical protein EVAR_53780_1 [Eumeta japonica]